MAGRNITQGDDAVSGLGQAGGRDWQGRIDACASTAVRSPRVVHPPDRRLDAAVAVDWTGLPLRTVSCLPRCQALALLDWKGKSGCDGRLRLQDEYLEWCVVRDADGGIRRLEFTTELPEFWRVLAAHAPAEALRVAAGFASERSLPASALFGTTDPFAAGVSAHDREVAFASAMLDQPGPYNSGDRALCCMVNPSNTLDAVVALTFAAAFPFVDSADPAIAAPARDVIPMLSGAAQDGRGSDPVLVERLGRLALEGRLVGLADPPGVFIVGVERARLRRPDGRPVPGGWFTASRGAGSGGKGRYRRLVLEVPVGEGLRVSDLVDTATEQPIRFGGQVADLVQLAVEFAVTPPGVMPPRARPCPPVVQAGPTTACADVLLAWDEFSGGRAAR